MAIKPTKPNESGGIKMRVGKGFGASAPDGSPKRPLIKANVRNAPLGGGKKIAAIKANGGLGGGNNLSPVGKLIAKRNPLNKPRMR